LPSAEAAAYLFDGSDISFRLAYVGDFNTAVVAPLVIHMPKAVVAAACWYHGRLVS
jgi:hypothetical protein